MSYRSIQLMVYEAFHVDSRIIRTCTVNLQDLEDYINQTLTAQSTSRQLAWN